MKNESHLSIYHHKFIPELQANEHWADKLNAEDIQDPGKLQEHGMKLYLR